MVTAFLHNMAYTGAYFRVNYFFFSVINIFKPNFLFQMYQGTQAMLTKGPFALFYGGEDIVDKLSTKTPFPTVLVIVLCSAIFQMSLFVLKKYKTRQNIKLYLHNLQQTLVENVTNVYGIIIIIISSVACFLFISYHFRTIKNNNEKYEKDAKRVPRTIFILCGVNFFLVILPFLRSFALRQV